MEQTKGYFRLKGKIWGLNNKEPFTNETGTIRTLSIGIQSSKENSNYVQLGKWANRPMNIKYKVEGMEKAEEIDEQTAITNFKEMFKDGDSVYVNLRVEPNAFTGKLDYIVSQIYIEKEPIDFNSESFEEVNELIQSVVVTENPSDRKVTAGIITWDEKMVELDLKLDDDIVNEYFQENIKVGDLVPVNIYVFNKPTYSGDGEESERTTLKGKKKTSGQKITGRELEYQITDVDTSKVQKKLYDREVIRQTRDLTQEGKLVKNNKTQNNTSAKVEEEDLPF